MSASSGITLLTVLVSALVLTGAVVVVSIRNLFRAALSLGVVLVGIAALFVLLEAEFVAFVQILVYVGAILTLVVFAVMLTARAHAGKGPADSLPEASRQQLPAAVCSIAMFVLLTNLARAVPAAQAEKPVELAELGRELITTLILPFEVISLVFVVALVGAVVIASSNTSPRSSVRR